MSCALMSSRSNVLDPFATLICDIDFYKAYVMVQRTYYLDSIPSMQELYYQLHQITR